MLPYAIIISIYWYIIYIYIIYYDVRVYGLLSPEVEVRQKYVFIKKLQNIYASKLYNYIYIFNF